MFHITSQVQTSISNIIARACELQNIKNYDYEITGTKTKGDGFFSEIYAVRVTRKFGEPLHLIVKLSSQHQTVRELNAIKESFENEIVAYNEIFPRLQAFQQGKQPRRQVNSIAKCYATVVNGTQESVALANLKSEGFICYKKQNLLDHNHISYVLKEYARLHALTFSYQDQQRPHYESFKIHNMWALLSATGTFSANIKSILTQARDLLPESSKIRSSFGALTPQTLVEISKLRGQHTTILHGDCWSNNIMFKYSADGEIDQLKFIDWQLVSIGSPVLDLSYFFYSSASRSTLAKLDDYLRIYHEAFSEFVIELGSDPDELYPFEVLKQHWKKYARFGMILGLFLHKVKLTDEDDILDLEDELGGEDGEEKLFADAPLKRQGEYEERVWDLIQHMYEIDAL